MNKIIIIVTALFLLIFSGCSNTDLMIIENNNIDDLNITNTTTYSSFKINEIISNLTINGSNNITNNYFYNITNITNNTYYGGVNYTAGYGLYLDNVTFNVNQTIIQNRVNQTCASGSSIRIIYENGSVDCELDSTGSNNFPTTLDFVNNVLTLGRNGLSDLTTIINLSSFNETTLIISVNNSLNNETNARLSIGNWTLDKTNYVNSTQLNSNLSDYYLNINPRLFINMTNLTLYIASINLTNGTDGTNGTNGQSSNMSVINNGDGTYKFVISYLNGTNYYNFTTSNLTGQQGIAGTNGTNGIDGRNGTDINATNFWNKTQSYNSTQIDNLLLSYVTSTQLSNNLTNYVTSSHLTTYYYNKSYIDLTFLNYYTAVQVSTNYALKTELTGNLTNYPTNSQLSSNLSLYYLASNPNSYITDGNTNWDNIYNLVNSSQLSSNLTSYALVTSLTSVNTSLNNEISARQSIGNWTLDKTSYNTTSQLNNLYVKKIGDNITGNIINTANVTANYFIGNGSQLTGIVSSTSRKVLYDGSLSISTGTNNISWSNTGIKNIEIFITNPTSYIITNMTVNNLNSGYGIMRTYDDATTASRQFNQINWNLTTTAGTSSYEPNMDGKLYLTSSGAIMGFLNIRDYNGASLRTISVNLKNTNTSQTEINNISYDATGTGTLYIKIVGYTD